MVILSLLLARGIQAQTCYYPDQSVEPAHIVCNASAQISLCCEQDATCLASGLCFSQFDTSVNTGSCTDKTGTDHSCFQQCPLSLGNDHGYHTLYRCNNNNWCCATGGNTTSCCDDPGVYLFVLIDVAAPPAVMGGTGFVAGFTIAPLDLLQVSSSTAAAGASATPETIDTGSNRSQTSAASSHTMDTETSHHTESTASASDATRTGLGAGLGLGVPLLAGLIVALFFLGRLSSQSNRQKQKTAGVIVDGEPGPRHERQEMESLPPEMSNSRHAITQELGA